MIRKLLIVLLLTVVLGAAGVGFASWQLHQVVHQRLNLDAPLLLEVGPGDTPNGLFRRLQADGILRDALWLQLHWRLKLAEKTLHRGEYRLQPGMSVADLLGLWQRQEVVQYSLTLVEGWSFRQLRAALAKQTKLELLTVGLTDADLMARLGYPDMHPEGRFFPDTYTYIKGMTDLELLRQALLRMEKILTEEWAKRDAELPYASPYEALIMASIVERETGVAHERPAIAGVFVRRLRKGMLLQTDPTVIYGMGEAYQGRITRADLRRPTPYNTYTEPGLPPTPIAMPGQAAIHAALHPAPGSSLFFVARGDGSHVFSDTLREHNKAVRQYQLQRRADYRSSPAPK